MSVLIEEMINWIKLYYGDAIFLTMAFFSYIYLFIYSSKIRTTIIYPSAFLLFLLLNPILYKIIFRAGRYWRFFWMLPNAIIIAAAITLIIKKSNNNIYKIIVLCLVSLFIVIKGTNVYQNAGFVKTQNYYKISANTLAVCDAILEKDKSPKCVMPSTLFCEARQYSGDIELMYGRDVQGYIRGVSEDVRKVYEYMESDNPDYDYILSQSLEGGYGFVVTYDSKPIDDITLDKYGYKLINNVVGYNIYYNSFDNWKITQYGNSQGAQSQFYTIEKDGKLVIIDGGWDYQYENVMSVIDKYDGKIDSWIITHPHFDHVGAFNYIMQSTELKSKIDIGKIYTVEVNQKRYKETAQEYDIYEDYEIFDSIMKNMDKVTYLHDGDELEILGLKMNVLSAWDKDVDSLPDHLCNNGSLMFKLIGNEESILFCADVQSEMEDLITNRNGKEALQADYVQCGHHGNWGLSTSFYDDVNPRVAFLDGPGWLYQTRDDIYDGYKTMDYFIEEGVTVYTFDSSPHIITLY